MEQKRITFFDTKPFDRESFDEANRSFGFTITYFKNRLASDTAIMAKDSEVICAFVNDIMDKQTIEVLEKSGVRLIALRSAGYNNIDLEAVYKRIHVVRVPDYSPHAVAEHAVALMLTLNRKTHKAYYRTRDNNFSIQGLMGFDMYGKTAGIVGTGKIGKALIRILRGFGIRLLAFDAYPDQDFAQKNNIQYVPLSQLYAQSDIISLHCPLSPETYHMINAESIASMKNGVMIINTGRGQLIDTPSLIEGLKKGKIGCAGLDVYEEESEYFFEDFSNEVLSDDVLARLLTFNNVLITSHQGFFTHEALKKIAETTLSNIKDFYEGKPLKNEICYRCNKEECRKKNYGRCF